MIGTVTSTLQGSDLTSDQNFLDRQSGLKGIYFAINTHMRFYLQIIYRKKKNFFSLNIFLKKHIAN